jgi:hypothetical protein
MRLVLGAGASAKRGAAAFEKAMASGHLRHEVGGWVGCEDGRAIAEGKRRSATGTGAELDQCAVQYVMLHLHPGATALRIEPGHPVSFLPLQAGLGLAGFDCL